MGYYIQVLTNVGINLIGVLSVFVITGLTGLFSLGQASFMAIGAYMAGIMAKSTGLGFLPCAVIGVLAGGLSGAVIALPTIKLRRDYIALITFGFGEAVIAVLNNLASITGGATGLISIPKRTTPLLVWVSVAVLTCLVWNIKKSRFGRQCIALKSDELTARAMGIDVNRMKMTAFVLSSMITAYAGVLYAFHTTYVDPKVFIWNRSAEWLIVVFFGGLGSLTGALLSGFVLGLLPEILRSADNWRIIIYCVVVLITINFRPQGVLGTYEFSVKRIVAFVKARLSRGVRS
jgi:branched-chain amino acid transport system permease protein